MLRFPGKEDIAQERATNISNSTLNQRMKDYIIACFDNDINGNELTAQFKLHKKVRQV